MVGRLTVTGHRYTNTRVRGLADWKPKASTLEVLASVNAVLFDALAVQAEALAPPQLEAIVLDEISRTWDTEAYERVLDQERSERDLLVRSLRDLELE